MVAARLQAGPHEAPKRVTEETRRLYANLITKPPDERQLSRPTFKLIQDTVKSLITETRTLRQVFNAADFEAANERWDKRKRANFVQRLIDFAAGQGEPLTGCVAAKLVAGLEPVKCNELLQALARIATARQLGHQSRHQDPMRPRTFTRNVRPGNEQQVAVASVTRPVLPLATSSIQGVSRSPAASRRTSRGEETSSSRLVGGRRRSSSHTPEAESPPKQQQQQVSTQHSSLSASTKQERCDIIDVQLGTNSETSPDATREAGMMSLQLLRANLKSLQRVLADIGQLEAQLKSQLAPA